MSEQVFTVRIKSKSCSPINGKTCLSALRMTLESNFANITVTPAESSASEFVEWLKKYILTCSICGYDSKHDFDRMLKLFNERSK